MIAADWAGGLSRSSVGVTPTAFGGWWLQMGQSIPYGRDYPDPIW